MVHLVGKRKLRGEEEGKGEDTAFTYLIKKKVRVYEKKRAKNSVHKKYIRNKGERQNKINTEI